MATCKNCTNTELIPICTALLNVGRITNLNTAVYVFIHNLTTDVVHRQSRTSTGSGDVVADLSKPSNDFYMEGHTYQIWVTLQNFDMSARLSIANAVEDTCFNMHFVPVRDENNALVTYSSFDLIAIP